MNLLLTQGNALQIPLADESVHCVVTSPPYWGLRDYGIGDQLGLEPTPEQFVENMVAVFREVKRVLRADGTCWLNLGDSYAHSSSGGGGAVDVRTDGRKTTPGDQVRGRMGGVNTMSSGLKVKDLCGIPWRVAFALQADGWWLRSDIIWSKPNPMPESVTDRPTKAHEYLFLLTKSARYYYDADAVREPHKQSSIDRTKRPWDGNRDVGGIDASYSSMDIKKMCHPSGRNRRTVWQIATAPYSGAHFATYPPALVEPCIKAGTSEHGVCPECGAPWERVTEPTPEYAEFLGKGWNDHTKDNTHGSIKDDTKGARTTKQTTTLGWQPTCDHYEPGLVEDEKLSGKFGDPIPATVFDPFAGSGTTLQVARQLGRNGVGLDLSLEYLRLARTRLSLDALDAWTEGSKKDGKAVTDLPMFEEMT